LFISREHPLKLLIKFNLVLLLVFGAGMYLIARNAHSFLISNAKQQVLQQAELMSASASATKDYTEQQVSPVLETTREHADTFLPQTIPFYAATVTFQMVRNSYPDYTIREAALNPTRLTDRAADWEADLIHYFRNNPSKKEVIGQRSTPTGEILYVAAPIVAAGGCLQCHSHPSVAPSTLVKRYGSQNGFGWQPNETVGSQIISVPMSVPLKMANDGFRELIISLGIIFLATLAMIDIAMYLLVIRPLNRVSRAADRISKGELDLPPLAVKGNDEISAVTASINRMHTSLVKAFEMLNG
jgi:HAMP domain-containing protein